MNRFEFHRTKKSRFFVCSFNVLKCIVLMHFFVIFSPTLGTAGVYDQFCGLFDYPFRMVYRELSRIFAKDFVMSVDS